MLRGIFERVRIGIRDFAESREVAAIGREDFQSRDFWEHLYHVFSRADERISPMDRHARDHFIRRSANPNGQDKYLDADDPFAFFNEDGAASLSPEDQAERDEWQDRQNALDLFYTRQAELEGETRYLNARYGDLIHRRITRAYEDQGIADYMEDPAKFAAFKAELSDEIERVGSLSQDELTSFLLDEKAERIASAESFAKRAVERGTWSESVAAGYIEGVGLKFDQDYGLADPAPATTFEAAL